MWNEDQIKSYVKDRISEKRFNHVLGVCDTAVKMAEQFNCNEENARIAALIHDCAKNMNSEEMIKIVSSKGYKISFVEEKSPQLLHGLVAAIIGENEMEINDEDIFNAVRYHTTGRKKMSILEKIIYLADYIEPSRNFPGVESLRILASKDLDAAVLMALENTIKHVITRGDLLHLNTVRARNHLLCKSQE